MKGMSELYLNDNNISDIGIGYLVPALKEMKGMTRLYLDGNNITNSGKNEILEVCKNYIKITTCWI